jgi:hypothetical protein
MLARRRDSDARSLLHILDYVENPVNAEKNPALTVLILRGEK